VTVIASVGFTASGALVLHDENDAAIASNKTNRWRCMYVRPNVGGELTAEAWRLGREAENI